MGNDVAQPIAFMVMPFNVKKTGVGAADVPAEVDFDALWEKVHRPVLAEMGYRPVRADQDVGALIIKEMIERLTLADLVLADLTLPNANVYYEIGVRHAASETGCVLISAAWSRPVFDLAQMRQLRFPLPEGKILAATAKKARAALRKGLGPLADGKSPVFQSVPGFPNAHDAGAFEEAVNDLMDFDAAVRGARAAPEGKRRELALEVRDQYGGKPVVRQTVVLELIRLLRDEVGWEALLLYMETLPKSVADHPFVLEQRALAISATGDPAAAIGELEALMRRDGETSERLGLIGGRYKALWRAATNHRDKARYLDSAIDAYRRGMLRDLNDYYPASNLPLLCRARGEEGDDRMAADAEAATVLGCEAAISSCTDDPWARATLLGVAFGRGDVQQARALLPEVKREGAAAWQLETTIKDLLDSVGQQADPAVRDGLAEVLAKLTALLPEPPELVPVPADV